MWEKAANEIRNAEDLNPESKKGLEEALKKVAKNSVKEWQNKRVALAEFTKAIDAVPLPALAKTANAFPKEVVAPIVNKMIARYTEILERYPDPSAALPPKPPTVQKSSPVVPTADKVETVAPLLKRISSSLFNNAGKKPNTVPQVASSPQKGPQLPPGGIPSSNAEDEKKINEKKIHESAKLRLAALNSMKESIEKGAPLWEKAPSLDDKSESGKMAIEFLEAAKKATKEHAAGMKTTEIEEGIKHYQRLPEAAKVKVQEKVSMKQLMGDHAKKLQANRKNVIRPR